MYVMSRGEWILCVGVGAMVLFQLKMFGGRFSFVTVVMMTFAPAC